MKLLTKAIETQLAKHPLNSGDDKPMETREIIVKYFTPTSHWTWHVTEGEKQPDGDWRLYGLVQGDEQEWGYFMLSELTALKLPLGLSVERDLYCGKTYINEVIL